MADSHQTEIKEQVLNSDTFVEAYFKDARKGQSVPWVRVHLRPVLLKGSRFLQFSYFDAQKHIAKNYAGAELNEKLDELIALPFKTIQVTTTNGRIRVQFTKKGKAIIHRDKQGGTIDLPMLAHDRRKQQILTDDKPIPFLQLVGIMTENGRVRANMRRKFRQINKFLELVDETADFKAAKQLQVADFGCGNAYLTLAIYHYLHEMLQIPTQLTGIDIKADLMARHNESAKQLGWQGVTFKAMSIEQFNPPTPPDVVLALHACDTATDDALAQGIKSGSRFIFSAPCCHHHLQAQLAQQVTPTTFDPVMRHGILKERLGDILTDSFRALILRIMGYRTDVIEFIATEHTPRNLMIRAVKTTEPGDAKFMQEYEVLKDFWQVTPFLETLIPELQTK
jgi:SAM-dependent methyltransferase